YIVSTPPSALLAPLAALFALLVLLARERDDYSPGMLASIGVCGGAMLATRFDMSAVFVGAATLYLSTRRVAAPWALAPLALVSFSLFDPYFRVSPVEQLFTIVRWVLFHAAHWDKTSFLESVTYASVFGVVSLALACVLLYSKRLASLPRDFAIFLVALSA